MKVFLFRHAQPASELTKDDEPALCDADNGLTEEGQRQARRLRDFLSAPQFVDCQLYCSPTRRAVETIEDARLHLGLKVVFDARLMERELSKMRTSVAESNRLQIQAYMSPELSVADSETVASHRARVRQWFEEVIDSTAQSDTSTLVVVSHGGTVEHLMGCFLGSLGHTLTSYYIPLACCCFHEITAVHPVRDRRVWRVDRIGSAAAIS